MRRALVVAALLVSACEQKIVLGSECPSSIGACASEQPPHGEDKETGGPVREGDSGDGDPPSSTSLDGGTEEPSRLDGGRPEAGRVDRDADVVPPRDARVPVVEDAGPALFPPFLNPSFELVDGGMTGALAEPLPGAGPTDSAIPPWYSCRRGFSVNQSMTYGFPGNQVTVQSKEGDTFLTDTFPIVIGNVNGLTQEFAEPLLPNRHYAFAVDLYAQPETPLIQTGDLVLDVASTDVGCLFGRKLADSSGVTPGSWQTRCLNFVTPPEGPLQPLIRGLMIAVNMTTQNPLSLSLTALHIDNIRPDPMCQNY